MLRLAGTPRDHDMTSGQGADETASGRAIPDLTRNAIKIAGLLTVPTPDEYAAGWSEVGAEW